MRRSAVACAHQHMSGSPREQDNGGAAGIAKVPVPPVRAALERNPPARHRIARDTRRVKAYTHAVAPTATRMASHGGDAGITGKRRRRPFYPGELEQLRAWGRKWGKINSDLGKRLRTERG